jgi:hypothetical protein
MKLKKFPTRLNIIFSSSPLDMHEVGLLNLLSRANATCDFHKHIFGI